MTALCGCPHCHRNPPGCGCGHCTANRAAITADRAAITARRRQQATGQTTLELKETHL